MNQDFFVLMQATSGNEKDVIRFRRYSSVAPVIEMAHDWLEKRCGVDCVPAEQEQALRDANGGELPEMTFLCPKVEKPEDLKGYNGMYNYLDGMDIFYLYFSPVYDAETAKLFYDYLRKEYEIGQNLSAQADRILGHMKRIVDFFEDDSLPTEEATEAIEAFLVQGGFSLFDMMDDEDYGLDTIVFPGGMSGQFGGLN